MGRDLTDVGVAVTTIISIHAPRVGRDIYYKEDNCMGMISIHAPRVGRDNCTPPRCCFDIQYFNPRAPCGARPSVKERSLVLL